jgi:hypothetical protein
MNNIKGPVPVIIGVAGHRNIHPDAVNILKQKVREILKDLQVRFPFTEFILLSSLREGAEQLVTGIALEEGFRLIVPLHEKESDAITAFYSDAAGNRYYEFLKCAEKSFLIPSKVDTSIGNQSVSVAAYIVRHCQILIALWDGSASGHTALSVSWQLNGLPDEFLPPLNLDPVETGMVLHVYAPQSGISIDPKGIQVKELVPESFIIREISVDKKKRYISLIMKKIKMFFSPGSGSPDSFYRWIIQNIDIFNRDWINLSPILDSKKEETKGYLIPAEMLDHLLAPMKGLANSFAIGDILSTHFRDKTNRLVMQLFWLVFISVLFVEIFAHISQDIFFVLLLYPFILLISVILFFQAKRSNWENKYLDYRALSEGLRVQFYWYLAGIMDSTADHYLRTQRTEMDWIRIAIKNLSVETRQVNIFSSTQSPQKRIQLILDNWISEQYVFFDSRVPLNDEKKDSYDFFSGLFIITSPVLALILAIIVKDGAFSAKLIHGFIFFIALTLVIAAMLEGYSNVKAFSVHSKRYLWMKILYAKAQSMLGKCLENPFDLEKSQLIIKELGREALFENGSWLLLHRERPIDLPKA